MAEYEACIFGIEASIDLRIKILEVYGDSALVIRQVKGDWEARDHKLILYKEHVLKLVPYFDEIIFHNIPREENQLADALATLASVFKVKWANEVPSIHINYLNKSTYYLAAEEESHGHPWFYHIKRYLENQEFPENASIIDKIIFESTQLSSFLVEGYCTREIMTRSFSDVWIDTKKTEL